MDRRMFLKATGAGLVQPAGLLALGPALVRQGNRRLKDITPDELMELLVWAKIDVEDVTTVEDMQRERGKPIASLHPQYWFEYYEGKPDIDLQDSIWFRYWWCISTDDSSEYDEVDGCIEIGDIRTHDCYSIASPIEMVKWFLGHGFRVW
jgi:hypothetical protein